MSLPELFPISSSNQGRFTYHQHFGYAMGCSSYCGSAESPHWVHFALCQLSAKEQWVLRTELSNLCWLWGVLISYKKKVGDKCYSTLYFVFSQLYSGSDLCGYTCTVHMQHGSWLLLVRNATYTIRFSSRVVSVFSSNFALKLSDSVFFNDVWMTVKSVATDLLWSSFCSSTQVSGPWGQLL